MQNGSQKPCLFGLTILCAGYTDQAAKQEVQQLLASLGAIPAFHYMQNVRADVLVASSVKSTDYQAAVKAQPDISTVQASWLRACQEAGRKVTTDGHQLGPFAGLEICISGYVKHKVHWGKKINSHGGLYNPELNRATCDVLVCEEPKGQKYKVGSNWGKTIVSSQWFFASIDAKHCKDTADYLLAPATPKIDLPASRVQPGPAPVLASAPVRSATGPARSATALATAATPPATAAAPPTQAYRPVPAAVRSITQNSTPHARSVVAATTSASTNQSQQQAGQPSTARGKPASALAVKKPERVLLDNQDCLFLSGVQLHLCCCTPEEQLQLVRIAREGCALRHAALTASLTHIVVGSDRTEAECQAVRNHTQQHRGQVKVVQAEWLRQCGEERRLLSAANGFLIPVSDLTANPPDARIAAVGGSGLSTQGLQQAQKGAGKGVGGSIQEPAGADGSSGEDKQAGGGVTASQAPANQALKDFWFTTAALETPGAGEDFTRAQALLRKCGGHRFSAPTIALLANVDRSNILALCPCTLTRQKAAQLQSRQDFAMVPEKQRVSMLWLEWVAQDGAFIDYQARGSVACRPFPFPLPMPGMSEVRITVSSYPDDVKQSIQQLVCILGGSFTKSMGRKNSHLLIRAAAGPKFAGCAARAVVPVTVDWLIDSAHAGRMLEERDFFPPSLAEGDTDAGFSQMPFDTQLPTQANLLPRFGAAVPPPPKGNPSSSQPRSLLAKVSQDARSKAAASSAGLGPASASASQSHGLRLPPTSQRGSGRASSKAQAASQSSQAAKQSRSGGPNLLETIIEGGGEASSREPLSIVPPATGRQVSELRSPLQLSKSPAATNPAGHQQSYQQQQDQQQQQRHQQQQDCDDHQPAAASGRHQQQQAQGPGPGRGDEQEEGQQAAALNNALSRLGGVLDSAGLMGDHAFSQYEAPDDADTAAGAGTGQGPSGRPPWPTPRETSVDSQGTSQNSLQRGKRKGRAAAAAKSKRNSRPPEDVLMSQMGCSQQVGYEGANMSTGIGPFAHGGADAGPSEEEHRLPSSAANRGIEKAEADSRLRLLQAANARRSSNAIDKDDLQEMGLL